MSILKYIINNQNDPVLFHKDIIHNTLNQKVKSAGFLILKYCVENNRFVAKCFGESTSLNIKANPEEDQKLIEAFLNNTQPKKQMQ